MRIAVASGKGGTGKTTIATSLANTIANQEIRLLDCDVEAPDAGLFLKPLMQHSKQVGIQIPVVQAQQCTFCGKCAEVCQFHAIAVIGKKTLVFPELCHGCGSCTIVCPESAITEQLDIMGILEQGTTEQGIEFLQGTLNIGEPMAVPVIRELKRWQPLSPGMIEIRDAPPGASCPVVETIRDVDFVLLVTEPTPFGLHDLKQVAQIVQALGIPAGVIINRDGIGDTAVESYCAEADLPILMRIPMERRIAEAIAAGKVLTQTFPEYRPGFQKLFETICSTVAS
jgi:MinD superfamily P-loop ATPase